MSILKRETFLNVDLENLLGCFFHNTLFAGPGMLQQSSVTHCFCTEELHTGCRQTACRRHTARKRRVRCTAAVMPQLSPACCGWCWCCCPPRWCDREYHRKTAVSGPVGSLRPCQWHTPATWLLQAQDTCTTQQATTCPAVRRLNQDSERSQLPPEGCKQTHMAEALLAAQPAAWQHSLCVRGSASWALVSCGTMLLASLNLRCGNTSTSTTTAATQRTSQSHHSQSLHLLPPLVVPSLAQAYAASQIQVKQGHWDTHTNCWGLQAAPLSCG